jgi:hypothetical protein
VEETDLDCLAKCDVIRMLQRMLPVASEEGVDLQMSGAAVPVGDATAPTSMAKSIHQGKESGATSTLRKQEISSVALKTLVLLVSQVILVCDPSRLSGPSEAASSLIQAIEGVVLSEFAQSVPPLRLGRGARSSTTTQEGDTVNEDFACQQIISSVKQFNRDVEGMYVPELIRSLDSRPNVTFSLWVYLFPDSTAGVQGIFSTGLNNSQYRGLLISNRCLQYQHASKNGIQSVVASNPLPVSEWVHVAVTSKARRIQIYTNGKKAAETKMEAETMDVSGYPLYIGTNFSSNVRNFHQGMTGLISNFRYLPQSSSPEEISALGAAGPTLVKADDHAYQLSALIFRTHSLAGGLGEKISCDPCFSLLLEAIEVGTMRVQRVLLRLLGDLLPHVSAETVTNVKYIRTKSQDMVGFLFGLVSGALERLKGPQDSAGQVNESGN